ncbi:DUF935 domain-containing protein [Phaeobacter inhibens]|uniref:DUF935 domain-containing protein n=1 Tax=Phaeobacter inhibens TaxID=221822 RepID=UPI00076BBA54|nr:DUF935 domain-containing protein [Phaeobacter inhibens]KXF92097.1 hypothetical protein AT574_03845 [Phaeobacter inhibens]WHP69933.1 DUF935 domain-containing protein [Phaeobacter inhibens]
MAVKTQVLDRFGNPMRKDVLAQEIAAPTIGGVRSPIAGYPADGLNPGRLASILREADIGNPVRYLELAEAIEERDHHYVGVLGTRKRSVSQLDITVEPGDGSPLAATIADEVRKWLKRDELTDELFDTLDALGKGYSFTEIIWDASEGQWEPKRLEWRDPRWFRFATQNLSTPMMLDDNGQNTPLPAFKFVFARLKAKSGLPLRGGIARIAAWSWMFKAYTQRDWAIFTQTYGQPLRIGKYGPGTSEEDRSKLFRAVANIAGDCAAIVPESMMIDFVEAKNLGASSDHYERRCDWLDKQTSKLVLGQTATTDAQTGGLGSGKEHREVQEDIERADAKSLAAILNRDLIHPWVQLNHGPSAPAPKLKIGRPEEEDLAAFSKALGPLISKGLRVKSSEVRAKFNLSEPGGEDEVLGNTASPSVSMPSPPQETGRKHSEAEFKHPFNTQNGNLRADVALQAETPSQGRTAPLSEIDLLTNRTVAEATPAVAGMMGQVEAMLAAADSLEEFAEMLRAGMPNLSEREFVGVLANAMLAAHIGGRAQIEDEADD